VQAARAVAASSKNRSENKGSAHTTTGKNRNTRNMSNRDQTGGTSGAEKGLHAEERQTEEKLDSGGMSRAHRPEEEVAL
jgi:hypothetical protein